MTHCQCGCGLPTAISHQTDVKRGYVKGQPYRFRPGRQPACRGCGKVRAKQRAA